MIAFLTEQIRGGYAPTLILAALILGCLLGGVCGVLDAVAYLIRAKRSRVYLKPPIPITDSRRRQLSALATERTNR